MTTRIVRARQRYQLVTIAILLAGLGTALLVYLTAGVPGESSMVENYEGSKRFVHDLELYGGKANVIANRFFRWFDGLWHGKTLAFTLAFLTGAIAAAYFILARLLTAGPPSRAGDDDRDRIDRRQ